MYLIAHLELAIKMGLVDLEGEGVLRTKLENESGKITYEQQLKFFESYCASVFLSLVIPRCTGSPVLTATSPRVAFV